MQHIGRSHPGEYSSKVGASRATRYCEARIFATRARGATHTCAKAPLHNMKYDLVVYGATGFTGQLVAAYLRTVPDLQGKRWAIAGRSASRLAALEAKLGLGAGVGQIAAELTDAAATADLVASTKAVINCAGPYSQNHAEELLGECARTGTHYSDLAGEGFWQAEMATKFHAAAEKSGAKIVLGGGVDSIPSDIGCMLAVDALLKSGGLPDGDQP